MSEQMVVKTPSGLTITLEPAGEDGAGNLLWRQVGSSLENFWDQWTQTNVSDIARDTYGSARRSDPS